MNEALASQIREAFRGVKLGRGTGLYEADALDCYRSEAECAEIRRKDEKEDWARLKKDDLNYCNAYFSFADEEGARFHLPAFMLLELRDEYVLDLIFDLAGPYTHEKFSLLNRRQQAAVRAYLLDFAQREGLREPKIAQSLREYWDHHPNSEA